MSKPLWTPSIHHIQRSRLYAFMQYVNNEHNLHFTAYDALYCWSINEQEAFWLSFWHFTQPICVQPPKTSIQRSPEMHNNNWFPDSELNFAENLLRFRDNHSAIIFRNEKGHRQCLSYSELFQKVSQCAGGLKRLGIDKGDVVAGFMPNIPQTVIAMLAATSLGAIWTSCSPDFGFQGIIDRFEQVKPRIIFTADGYYYSGKTIDSLPTVSQFTAQISSIKKVIVAPYVQNKPDISTLNNACLWDEFIDHDAKSITFVPLPFNAPLYVMYSSGTTGKPKCIVHGVGGTLIQHLKEHQLHTDIQRDDRFFYYTTCGWMMWNWLVSGLASGCTLILYDGAPMEPTADYLWQIAEEERITVFGTSAKYITSLMKAGISPKQQYDLSALRTILSTGSPLSQEGFEYVYEHIADYIQLASISGGTDIISCFALGCPILPVYSGELQCKGLGMAVNIFDEDGHPLQSGKGELVCEKPFPSMPVGFWNDVKGENYHNAYFNRFENVWAHGDYAEFTEQDGLIIHGRSDVVLNPGGVRIGTAEIYREVDKVAAIQDSICIGQPWQGDTRIILFVVLQPEYELDKNLIAQIQATIKKNTSPRHVPAKIIQVNDIPRTISGKIVELAVKQVVIGETVKNREALANPEALDQFKGLEALKT